MACPDQSGPDQGRPGAAHGEWDPECAYLLLASGSPEEQERLCSALASRGVPILERRQMARPEGPSHTVLILKLPGGDYSGLVLELMHEGIGGDLSAYGRQTPERT